jgi:hypothetical protein
MATEAKTPKVPAKRSGRRKATGDRASHTVDGKW